jgi:hypothetical protein
MIEKHNQESYIEEIEKKIEKLLYENSLVDLSVENASILSELGSLFYKLGDSYNELKYIQKALMMKRKLFGFEGDHIEISNELINLGNAYSHNGEFKYELNYKIEGMKMLRRLYEKNGSGIDNQIVLTKYYHDLAIAYRNNDDHVNELKFQIDAYDLTKNLNNPELEAQSIDDIGTVTTF